MKIKICGLTDPAEAEYLNRNHVDYAGMVLFFPKSRRSIDLARAKEIMAALDPAIQKVAVLVSPTAEQARAVADAGFDILQAHGEIPPELLRERGAETPEDVLRTYSGGTPEGVPSGADLRLPLWKAFNVKDMDSCGKYHACARVRGYVFDAAVPGSGKTFDWNLVQSIPRDEKQFLLAGGLNPQNVRDAIRALHPDGVDVSSGVEAPGGGKDGRLVDEFVTAVRSL